MWNTGCRMVTNDRATYIYIVNGEDTRYTLKVPPNRGQRSFEGVQFPWCNSDEEIQRSAFRVHDGPNSSSPVLFYIFQYYQDNIVYYSVTGKLADRKKSERLDGDKAAPNSDHSFTVTGDGVPNGNKTPDDPPLTGRSRGVRETFELFTTRIGDVAEHTYLKVPSREDRIGNRANPGLGTRYFLCWGGCRGEDGSHGVHRRSFDAYFLVPNAYRIGQEFLGDWREDTAGYIYAVNGVCHQSANRFLLSGGGLLALKDGVRGLWASLTAYGPYGTFVLTEPVSQGLFFAEWKKKIYDPAWSAWGPTADGATEAESTDGNARLFLAVQAEYASALAELGAAQRSPQAIEHELVWRTSGLFMRDVLPDLDVHDLLEPHLDLLRQKDRILASKDDPDLPARINELIARFQVDVAARIGEEAFRKIASHPSTEAVQIVDPSIWAASRQS